MAKTKKAPPSDIFSDTDDLFDNAPAPKRVTAGSTGGMSFMDDLLSGNEKKKTPAPKEFVLGSKYKNKDKSPVDTEVDDWLGGYIPTNDKKSANKPEKQTDVQAKVQSPPRQGGNFFTSKAKPSEAAPPVRPRSRHTPKTFEVFVTDFLVHIVLEF